MICDNCGIVIGFMGENWCKDKDDGLRYCSEKCLDEALEVQE